MYTSYAPSFARDITTTPEGIKFTIDSGKLPVKVVILEDIFAEALYFDPGSDAETSINFNTELYDNVIRDESGAIKSLRRKGFTIYVQSKYKIGIKTSVSSVYGRGTTSKDKKSGDVTLEFHESQHAAESLQYIHKNQVPDFIIKIGASESEVQKILDAFSIKINAYVAKLEAYHIASVDCVGVKALFCK